MKIDLTNMALTGRISPFEWGMNWRDIQTIYPDWEEEIATVQKHKEGYLCIDSVEFYFEEQELVSLNEIVIKNFQFNEKYESSYFDKKWLDSGLNYSSLKSLFKDLKLNYEETKGPRTGTPILIPNRNSFFGLYEEDLELCKIYLRRAEYDNHFFNGNKYKIEKHINN